MDLSVALAAWSELLGAEHVRTGAAERAAAATATFATTQRVAGLIFPATRDDVRACLLIAGRCGVPIWPISAGKNWGYGSRVPLADGSVLMSLARLDRIIDYSERLAYVTLEPGVTFRRLHGFLLEQGSNLLLNGPGSTPDASVIGNALERGISQGLDGERWNQICGLEVVLASGWLLHTGYGRFANAPAAPLARAGPGPCLDGLFSQSNLGVVTALTIWLAPRPAHVQSFTFRIRGESGLAAAVDRLQELKMAGVIDTGCSLFNDCRMMAFLGRYPWSAGGPPLPAAERARFQGRLGGAWYGEGGIGAASPAIGRAKQAYVAERLAEVVDNLRWSPSDQAGALFDSRQETGLDSVYWRKTAAPPPDPDPDRDRCGVIWLAPVLPFAGDHVRRCVEMIEDRMRRHPFEPSIGLQGHSPRSIYVTIAIIYDRELAGQDELAMACYRDLLDHLGGAGYLPYRLGIQSMAGLPAGNDDTPAVLGAIKLALDPQSILAPGRYDFAAEQP